VCECSEGCVGWGVVLFILFMTTLQPRLTKDQEEIKAWIHADFLRTLDELGYSSYQEFLDAMEYEEMMANACFPDPNW
jgi:hypothetical protein